MKIIKMYRSVHNGFYCVFDKIPEITYEKIGADYVGSAVDGRGRIIFSEWLKFEGSGPTWKAFAGSELSLKMKDGSIQVIKDNWWDNGNYKKHGEFIGIGGGTLKSLQDCYVYCHYNINKDIFNKMLEDYYLREKEYEYHEIEKWIKMQYKWFPVRIAGREYPIMVNDNGDFADMFTKEPIYAQYNICQHRKGKSFELKLFKWSYKDDTGRLIKIEKKLSDVLEESIPKKIGQSTAQQ